MATDIQLTIAAQDAFSPTFATLERALERTRGAGSETGRALEGMGEGLRRVGERSGEAAAAMDAFAGRSAARLARAGEREQAALQARAERQVEAARALHERMLALDAAHGEERAALQAEQHAGREAQQAAHLQRMLDRQHAHNTRARALERARLAETTEVLTQFYRTVSALAEQHGSAAAQLTRTLGVAEALVKAYVAANNALAAVPPPANLPLSALILARGLANVERIRQVNVAHGGLEEVPQDATFVLRRGERVLSPGQNRQLSRFLERETRPEGAPRAQPVVVEQVTMHVLENATSAEALLQMDPAALRQVVAERLIPALDELARLGIRPDFTTSNT